MILPPPRTGNGSQSIHHHRNKYIKYTSMEFVDREGDVGDVNFWVAVSNGDLDMVKQMLDDGVSPNAQDQHGYSPL